MKKKHLVICIVCCIFSLCIGMVLGIGMYKKNLFGTAEGISSIQSLQTTGGSTFSATDALNAKIQSAIDELMSKNAELQGLVAQLQAANDELAALSGERPQKGGIQDVGYADRLKAWQKKIDALKSDIEMHKLQIQQTVSQIELIKDEINQLQAQLPAAMSEDRQRQESNNRN